MQFQENKLPLHESIFYRSNECFILTKTSLCSQKHKKLLQRNNKSIKWKANSLAIPLKPKAPISLASPKIIKVTIQSYRIENKMLKSEIQNLQHEISKLYMKVGNGRAFSSSLLLTIIVNNHLPFFEIFSIFLYFCSNFQIFCQFLTFFCRFPEKSHGCPYFLE